MLKLIFIFNIFIFTFLNAQETSSSLTRQKLEVMELKKELNTFYEEKEKQRFNSDLASGDVLYFSGKSLIIDTELLEKFNMSHKLTDIVNVIAPSLSKDTSLEFELLLKSQDSFKRTGYYLSAMPHNVYEEVNKVLI